MKFQDLPCDLIVKMLHTVDQATFENIQFANSTIEQISTADRFFYQYVKEIRFENDDKFFATLRDGTNILIGPVRYLKEQTPRQKSIINRLRKLKHFPTLAFNNCKIKDNLLGLIVGFAFRELRTVDHLKFDHCKYECSEYFDDVLRRWSVKDLTMHKTYSRNWYISDKTLALLKGNIDLDVEREGNWLVITSESLNYLIEEERKVFKLAGLTTAFNIGWVFAAINVAVEKNLTVDWDFGTIITDRLVELDDKKNLRQQFEKLQSEGFQLSSEMDEYYYTIIKLEKSGMTIRFKKYGKLF